MAAARGGLLPILLWCGEAVGDAGCRAGAIDTEGADVAEAEALRLARGSQGVSRHGGRSEGH